MSCSMHRRHGCTLLPKCRQERANRRRASGSTDVSFDDGSTYDYGTSASSSDSSSSSSSSSDSSSSGSSSCD